MKILHVVPSFYPAHVYGGPIESVYALCRHLVRQGCQVRVLTTDANGLGRVLDVEKEREVTLPERVNVRYCRRWARHSISWDLLRRLPEYADWADLVHLTAVYSFPTLPTLVACKMLGKPLVWSPRGALQRWPGSKKLGRKKLFQLACAAMAPRRLTLHVTAQAEADESREIFRRAGLALVGNGVEIPENPAVNREPAPLRLVFLGRLDAKKGLENLLHGCAKLATAAKPEFTLVIAGAGEPGYQRSLSERIRSLGLSGHVQMIGAVHGAAKAALFASAAMVIVPSHTENFAMVVAEALAHGVPVIASKGTPWRGLEERRCGLWVENDAASLADAIARMSQMALAEMGRRGRQWMEQEFSWDERALEMIRVYEACLRNKLNFAAQLTPAA